MPLKGQLFSVVLLSSMIVGCYPSGRWVYQEPLVTNPCPGGKINQVKRVTDTHLGRVRQTVTNTDSCLE